MSNLYRQVTRNNLASWLRIGDHQNFEQAYNAYFSSNTKHPTNFTLRSLEITLSGIYLLTAQMKHMREQYSRFEWSGSGKEMLKNLIA